VEEQVPRDPRQPAAEAAARRVGVPAIDGAGHRTKHLLTEVARVSVLKPLAPGQPVDKRLVKRHEFAPGLGGAGVAEPGDQRMAGRRRFFHCIASRLVTHGARENLSPNSTKAPESCLILNQDTIPKDDWTSP